MIKHIFNIIKGILPTRILIVLLLHIVILIGMLHKGNLPFEERCRQFYYQLKLNDVMSIPTILETLVLLYFVMFVSYLVLSSLFKNKLKPKFGALWDRNKEPYCPSCKILLTNYSETDNDNKLISEFSCIKCNSTIYLQNYNNPIKLSDAQNNLNKMSNELDSAD